MDPKVKEVYFDGLFPFGDHYVDFLSRASKLANKFLSPALSGRRICEYEDSQALGFPVDNGSLIRGLLFLHVLF